MQSNLSERMSDMNIVKISDLPDINEVTLTPYEISSIINCIDNSIFELIDDISINLEYVNELIESNSGVSEEEIDIKKNILTNQIPVDLHRLSGLVTLITHVDPSYNAETDTHCELYNLDTYLDNLKKLSKMYAETISKDIASC